MTKLTEILKNPRQFMLNCITDLTVEQLNEVPPGFNNNIVWNLAHLISAQQGICYARAGVPIAIEDKFYTPYRPGTKPEKFVDADEIAEIKNLLTTTIDQLEADYANNIFINYEEVTTRYGVTLSSIDDAFAFLPFHEGFHIGYIMALKREVLRGK